MILQELSELCRILGQRFKSRAYQKAARQIQAFQTKIAKDNKGTWSNLEGIGKSIERKIVEYIETGKITKLEKMHKDKKIKAIYELRKIKGIGPQKAIKLVNSGITSKAKLQKAVKDKKITLTAAQLLCLEHFRDLQKRIPGKEIDMFSKIFKKIKIDGLVVKIVGSYRRNKRTKPRKTSGDIDVILFHNVPSTLALFVKELQKHVWLKRVHAGKSKYWGLIRLKNSTVRHLDIRIFEHKYYAPAMLHFTGSKENNIMMRTIAIQKGMKLNEYGLFNQKTNKYVPVRTERDIFKALKLVYISPTCR